jgi:hypothetical protein
VKTVVDPNAPKRPANAFIMFSEISRESMKEERKLLNNIDPGSEAELSLANLTKALGSRWRQLPRTEREIYQSTFKDVVKLHETDYRYYLSLSDDSKANPGVLDWLDPQCPKRPANHFMTFCDTEDDRMKESSEKDRTIEEEKEELARIAKGYAHRWLELTAEERICMLDSL